MPESPVAGGSVVAASTRFLAVLSQRSAFVFLLGFLALGAMTTVVIPAFQVPDENGHWWVALRRASALFGGNRTEVCGAAIQLPYHVQFDRMRWKSHERMRLGLAEGLPGIPAACTGYGIPYGIVTTYPSVVIGYPLFFADAQRDGTAAARYFYFSRLMSGLLLMLVFWRMMQAFAARGPTPGLVTIASFFWSPLFVQQAFSVSADTPIQLFALATIIVCLRVPRVPWLDFAVFIAAGVTATWTKPTVVPIALIPALWVLAYHLPGAPWRLSNLRYFWRRLSGDRQGSALVLTSCLLVGSGFVGFAFMGGSTGVSVIAGPLNPPAQMTHVQQHLGTTMNAFIANIRFNTTLASLNGILGWLDTPLPVGLYLRWRRVVHAALVFDGIFVLLLLIQAGHRWYLRRLLGWLATSAGILLGSFASMVAVTFAMYVTTTGYTSGAIEGVQPRYFFPSVLVAALALSAVQLAPAPSVLPPEEPPTWHRRLAAVLTAVVLSALVLSLFSIFSRLYLSLWARYW